MDIFFTYLKEKKHKRVVDFLNKEIEYIDYLISLNSDSEKHSNKFLNDYSNSLFITSDKEDDDSIILN